VLLSEAHDVADRISIPDERWGTRVNGRAKVSIGMPVYNAEGLLSETLDSILNQTFRDFEVVISDNASTDATPEICRSYAARDERIRYEPNETNIGIIANFNRAFRLARAEYFKWQAHDDLLAPEYLERCVEILDDDPLTVLVGTRVGLIEEDGSPVPFDAGRKMFVTSYGEEIPPPTLTDMLSSPKRLERFRGVLFDVTGPVHGAFVFGLFRSDALAQTPLIEGYIGAEKVLLGRLSLEYGFREVPMELFLRRYHRVHAGLAGKDTWRGLVRIARNYGPERRVILFPLARQIRGYLRAIEDADISRAEKIRCAAMVLEKVATVAGRRLKGMGTRIREAAR
jgi:glycosyltransferase involved in cell wall biosynthesis